MSDIVQVDLNQQEKEESHSWFNYKIYHFDILISSFMLMFTGMGQLLSFGVFYEFLLYEFSASRSYTSWIIAIAMGFFFFSGLFASYFISLIGSNKTILIGGITFSLAYFLSSFCTEIWHMFITYGFLSGTAIIFMNTTVYVVTSSYYTKWKALAVGSVTIGAGAGTGFWSYIFGIMLDSMSWQAVFRIQSIITLVLISISANFQNINKESDLDKSSAVPARLFKDFILIRENIPFAIFLIGNMLTAFVYYWSIFYLVDIAKSQGMDSDIAISLMTYFGCSGIIGCFATGFLSNYVGPLTLYSLIPGVMGLSTILFSFFPTLPITIIHTLIYGFFANVFDCMLPIALICFVGERNMNRGTGIFHVILALFIVSGPPLAGYLVDNTGSYFTTLIVAGIPTNKNHLLHQ